MNHLVTYLLNLAIGTLCLLAIFANGMAVQAENLPAASGDKQQQTEIGAGSFNRLEIKKKPLVEHVLKQPQKVELKGMKLGPSKSALGSEGQTYDVKMGPIKKAQTLNQSRNNTPTISGTIEAKPMTSPQRIEQRFEVRPQSGPVQRISPLPQEQDDGAVNVKITRSSQPKPISSAESVGQRFEVSPQSGPVQRVSPLPQEQSNGAVNVKVTGASASKTIPLSNGNQESFDKRIKVTGEKQIIFSESLSPGEPQSRFTPVEGPAQPIDADKVEQVQIPIRDRLQVSENIRAWKLDESGKKTNEETTIRVIKRVMQPNQNK